MSVILFTGCASEEAAGGDVEEPKLGTSATSASPVVGTWRWSGSGGRLGDVALGEEDFIFREDGTYAVISTAGDGSSECYEGVFTWSTSEDPSHGIIVFKGSHVPDRVQGVERDVYLADQDTLRFGEAGTYRRTGPVLPIRCP